MAKMSMAKAEKLAAIEYPNSKGHQGAYRRGYWDRMRGIRRGWHSVPYSEIGYRLAWCRGYNDADGRRHVPQKGE